MRQRPQPEDDADRDLMDLIDKYGWGVRIVVDPEGELPNFHYSAGIAEKCGAPELLVIGLSREVGHWVVNEYARRCLAGDTFEAGCRYDGFLEDHTITFIDIDSKLASVEYTTSTDWYYRRERFPLRQLVWPDIETGAFPWQDGFRQEIRDRQPILGATPTLQ